MAAATSLRLWSSSNCCQRSSINSSQFGYRSSASPASLNLSFPQTYHPRCFKEVQRLTVTSRRNSKTAAATVTLNSWDELVLKNKFPVLVEFYASWCGPCQMVHRLIDEIALEYRGKLECLVLNADNDLPVAEEYDIKAVPVVLLFKNGIKQDSIVGTMPKESYVAAVERVLAS